MKRIKKVLAGITAFVLISALLWIANSFVGNPVSKILANKSAEKFITENYPEMDLESSDVFYSFKDGDYHVRVKSPSSIDTHFDIRVSPFGEVLSTTYKDNVVDKFNTWSRINDEYRAMVDSVLQKDDFPYESDIDYGEIPILHADNDSFRPPYGLQLEDLEIDGNYDLTIMGGEVGHIVFYTYDKDVSAKRAGEILLDLKKIFDKSQVPFYAMDFSLSEPRDEKKKPMDLETFSVNNFLYEDIHDDDLTNRLEVAAEELAKYYEKQDSKK